MITCKIIFSAEHIVIDSSTNGISAFNILDDINPTGLPLIFPKFSILAILERAQRDPSKVGCVLQITNDGKELYQESVLVNFQDVLRARTVINLANLLVPRPGSLTITLSLDDKVLGQYIVEVRPRLQQAVMRVEPAYRKSEQQVSVQSKARKKRPRKHASKK